MSAYGVFLIICMMAILWLELGCLERVLKKILAKIGEPVEPPKNLSDDVRYMPVNGTGYRWDILAGDAVCSCCLAEKNAVVYLEECNPKLYVCPCCTREFNKKEESHA